MDRPKAGQATTHRDQLPGSSRYELLVRVASGGMATVYVGRLSGAVGFSRLVAIKRAHAHLLEDPAFSRMLTAEARLAAKIHHPNVVAVQDVEELEGELLLVMDYVEGASLAALIQAAEESGEPLSARVAVRVILDACAGLHAAHELTDDQGRPMHLVHRDVSPHNLLVGVDGMARLADFGIAKVSQGGSASMGATATGALKGKVAYMAPEYVEAGEIDPRGDVFAMGVVAWEALTRHRLFRGSSDMATLRMVIEAQIPRPSSVAPWLGAALDDIVLKALARSPDDRWPTAQAFAEALEAAARREELIAPSPEVARVVRALVGPTLDARRTLIRDKSPPDEKRPEISGVTARAPSRPSPGAALAAGAEPATLTLPVPLEATGDVVVHGAKSPEATTLGSGVSSQNVGAVRAEARGRRVGRRRAAVGAALVLAAVATAFVTLRMRPTARPPVRASEAVDLVPSSSASAAAPAESTTSAITTTTATAPAPATATATATPTLTPSARPPAPRAPPRTRTVAAPPPPRDKAPPNPYAN